MSIVSELERKVLRMGDVALEEAEDSVRLDPVSDKIKLTLKKTFYPLGFPIQVATNSRAVLVAAEENWGHFLESQSCPPLQFHICVSEGMGSDCSRAPVYRTQGNLFSIVSDPHNFAICDLKGGFASAWLTETTVEQKNYLRYFYLEAVAMCLLTSLYVTPIHAACVEIGGSGVLLCGDSGAGKSSLAFACARAGWTYISDDASYLIRDRRDRYVVGNSHQVRLRPSAAGLFPELENISETPRVAGKPSIEAPITSLIRNASTAAGSLIKYVVFLNRATLCSPNLTLFSRSRAEAQLKRYFWGDDETQTIQVDSLRRLLTAEVLELHYSDLDGAVSRLEGLVR